MKKGVIVVLANTDKPKKIQQSVSLSPDLVDRLKDLADEDGRTLSGLIQKVVQDYIHAVDYRK